jgi:hypothetical protein
MYFQPQNFTCSRVDKNWPEKVMSTETFDQAACAYVADSLYLNAKHPKAAPSIKVRVEDVEGTVWVVDVGIKWSWAPIVVFIE